MGDRAAADNHARAGQALRHDTASGAWKDTSPLPEADTCFGHSGLTVDRQRPGTVLVTGYSSWWPGGFQADTTVRNTGPTTVDGWKADWSFADGRRVDQMWNATFAQSGSRVTASSMGWNAKLAPDASAAFGVTGSNSPPRTFEVNGTACATG